MQHKCDVICTESVTNSSLVTGMSTRLFFMSMIMINNNYPIFSIIKEVNER